MQSVSVCTIGFTKTSAENFFERLHNANVTKIIDVRLHNSSQLSGFAKSDDLAFFLNRLESIAYMHLPILAPESEMLSEYRKTKGGWDAYAKRFLELMAHRRIEDAIDLSSLEGACLLCSEHTADHCHRRLVCDYLNNKWGNKLIVSHL